MGSRAREDDGRNYFSGFGSAVPLAGSGRGNGCRQNASFLRAFARFASRGFVLLARFPYERSRARGRAASKNEA
jgi:hypothetical protein